MASTEVKGRIEKCGQEGIARRHGRFSLAMHITLRESSPRDMLVSPKIPTYREGMLGDSTTPPPADELDLAAPDADDLTSAELESLAAGAKVELDVRSLQGRDRDTLVHDFHFTAEPGTVNLLVGASPAARWALACVLAGRLPSDRFAFHGRVQVAGRQSAPMLRSLVSLAQPWRIRDSETEVERRLRALDWAEPMQTPLVILSPGLDGLDADDRTTIMTRARQIAANGTTVIVTARSEHPGDLDDRDPLRGAVGTIEGTSVDTAAA